MWLNQCMCAPDDKNDDDLVYLNQQDNEEELIQKLIDEQRHEGGSAADDQWLALPTSAEFYRFSLRIDQPIKALPLCEGNLWYLNADDSVTPVYLAIYVNGFTITDDSAEESCAYSPFSLVRNCKMVQPSNSSTAQLKMFKVSLFSQGIVHFFGVEDEATRSRWVINASHAIRTVTHSLFPPFKLRWTPIKGNLFTYRRILAGYLLHDDGDQSLSVVYCELHPSSPDRPTGLFRAYKSARCEQILFEVELTPQSKCVETPGINCSCFSIEERSFCARTMAERRLWLRSISNLQVKLFNEAPPPDDEELIMIRASIGHHIHKLGDALILSNLPSTVNGNASQDTNACEQIQPLLQRLP